MDDADASRGAGRGRGRRPTPVGAAPVGAPARGAGGDRARQDLRRRLAELEEADAPARAHEQQLRAQLSEEEAGLEYARKLERKAEEQVDIAKRLEVRSSEILGGEFSDLMRKIARLEEDEKTRKHNEESWKRELDAIVLEQASFMERRDNFRKEMEQLEAIARADGAKVAEAEARVKRAEGKVGKEKLRVELLTRELEALKADAEKARSELQRNAQARRGLQHQEAAASASNTSSLEFWRSVSLCLCAAAAAVGLWRAMDPALW